MYDAVYNCTCSLLSVCKVRGHDDPPLLPYTHALQTFIHPRDHVAHPDVGVIGAVTLVAVTVKQQVSVLALVRAVSELLVSFRL